MKVKLPSAPHKLDFEFFWEFARHHVTVLNSNSEFLRISRYLTKSWLFSWPRAHHVKLVVPEFPKSSCMQEFFATVSRSFVHSRAQNCCIPTEFVTPATQILYFPQNLCIQELRCYIFKSSQSHIFQGVCASKSSKYSKELAEPTLCLGVVTLFSSCSPPPQLIPHHRPPLPANRFRVVLRSISSRTGPLSNRAKSVLSSC